MNNRPLLYQGEEFAEQPVRSGEDWERERGNQASEVLAEKQGTPEEQVHERIRSCSRRKTTEVHRECREDTKDWNCGDAEIQGAVEVGACHG